jgi:hypothetical protein
MSKSHNKKRNVGIIYELLLRNISDSLIRNDKNSAQKALRIIENRFHKSKELYREFRLFNALAKTTVSDTAVAASILTEAKHAARRCDVKKLNREKSLLIRDINYELDDKNFYYRRIPEYTVYATIQTLLNDWRQKDTSDLSKVVQYESKMVERLLEQKVEKQLDEEIDSDVDKLVVKLLSEKFNKKYGNQFNDEQKSVIRSYVFSITNDNGRVISKILTELKENTLSEMSELSDKTSNETLLQKIAGVREKIVLESVEEVTDETISRFLVISQLKTEITEALDERE